MKGVIYMHEKPIKDERYQLAKEEYFDCVKQVFNETKKKSF